MKACAAERREPYYDAILCGGTRLVQRRGEDEKVDSDPNRHEQEDYTVTTDEQVDSVAHVFLLTLLRGVKKR